MIKQVLLKITNQLQSQSPTPRLDAEVLLCHVLQTTRAFLYAHDELELTPAQDQKLSHLVLERCHGTPIAYLTGRQEFWSLPLHVSPATLIPRPETEQLVTLVLERFKHVSEARILDLGTGSGAIALAIAHERPKWQILASDQSTDALAIAQLNAESLQCTSVQFKRSDWFQNLAGERFNAILSNPPYLAVNDPHLTEGDVRAEPLSALVSGEDGLNAIRHIIHHSKHYLLSEGLLLIEHGYNQGEAVNALLNQAGYRHVNTWQDLQGHDRISGGTFTHLTNNL